MAAYKQNDEFDKLGKELPEEEKRGRGRPAGSTTVGKANIKALARKAAAVSEEALNLIVEIMRNSNNKEELRFKAATYIVGATQSLISQVDKQTLLNKQYALLDKKIEESNKDGKPVDGGNEDSDDDDLTGRPAVFSLEIVS